jgi:hypothetical protein
LPASTVSCGFSIFRPILRTENPDELVWKHLKTDTAGRASITGLDDFRGQR